MLARRLDAVRVRHLDAKRIQPGKIYDPLLLAPLTSDALHILQVCLCLHDGPATPMGHILRDYTHFINVA